MSIKSFSISGLLLIITSAIISAGLKNTNTKPQDLNDGILLQNSGTAGSILILSCVLTQSFPFECTATNSLLDSTTGRQLPDSFVGTPLTDQTVGNTSNTLAISGNQNSEVM